MNNTQADHSGENRPPRTFAHAWRHGPDQTLVCAACPRVWKHRTDEPAPPHDCPVVAVSTPCAFGDPTCPCQDGDPCHYVDLPGSPAMDTPPRTCRVCGSWAEVGMCVSCAVDRAERIDETVDTDG